VRVDIDRPGIAVRVEIPREFGSSIFGENDTSFVESDIANDYYYINVVDEARHWSYDWNRTVSDGPCFKPGFAFYDQNAPWCVEVWNYLNNSFLNFTAPKFVKLNLVAPRIAGMYNFTIYVADHVNVFGYPDFVHAWNKTLLIPVSMRDNPTWINGTIRDCYVSPFSIPILTKGVAYAIDNATGRVARAYVNETDGTFSLTGLDRSVDQYFIAASAGIYREPDGSLWAFSLTPYQINGGMVGTRDTVGICLKRAPQIWGTIAYFLSPLGSIPVPRSLTDHPWLTDVGFRVLNVTVEATDSTGHVYRNQTVSTNSTTDDFNMITGIGENYTGLNALGSPDPYGTTFAGLPQTEIFTFRAWISGYTMKDVVPTTVTVFPPCGDVACGPPNTGVSPSIRMWTAGMINGTITLNHCSACSVGSQYSAQTPNQAELNLPNTPVTQKLYGGNVVIEAYDHTGTLRGIAAINHTLADGKTGFADSVSIPFFIIGFSEFYNRSSTFAGSDAVFHGNDPSRLIPQCAAPGVDWCWKDYGLDEGQYTLKVYIRGYEMLPGLLPTVFVPAGQASSHVNATMVEGAAISVVTTSYDNRPGTRVIQAQLPWRFLNLSIPVRARIYFYDPNSYAIGYEERLMITGIPTPPNGVELYNFKVIFAGQNWSMRDILFFGWRPSHVSGGNYTLNGYTLGYVHYTPGLGVLITTSLGALSQARLALLYGNAIGVTGVLEEGPGTIFIPIPEHQHVIAEANLGAGLGLGGAMIQNLTAGFASPLELPIYGFGAMELNRSLTGLGHFFYVPRSERLLSQCNNFGFNQTDFNHCFDYGLDKGNYYPGIPEFGFERHFTVFEKTTPAVSFDDLFLAQDAFSTLVLMAEIRENRAVVGASCDGDNVPLSWIQVLATSLGPSRSTPTLDGTFTLFLRADSDYSLTFYLTPLYPQQPLPGISLQNLGWGSVTPILPPDGLIPESSVCPGVFPSFTFLSGEGNLVNIIHAPETSSITILRKTLGGNGIPV
jgi:hypothetical protein